MNNPNFNTIEFTVLIFSLKLLTPMHQHMFLWEMIDYFIDKTVYKNNFTVCLSFC